MLFFAANNQIAAQEEQVLHCKGEGPLLEETSKKSVKIAPASALLGANTELESMVTELLPPLNGAETPPNRTKDMSTTTFSCECEIRLPTPATSSPRGMLLRMRVYPRGPHLWMGVLPWAREHS